MTDQAIVVINAGSSSVKFSVFFRNTGTLDLRIRGQIEALFSAPRFVARDASGTTVSEKSWPDGTKLGHEGALAHLFEFLRGRADGVKLIGVGHRVVHGGMEYTQPVRVDATVLAALDRFVPLAPLHQPHNLAAIRAVMHRSPDVPQVACFDTAFHRTNPEIAQMFALPYELHEAGVRRYGFHGLSYEYIASVLPAVRCEGRAGPHRRAAPRQRRQHVRAGGRTQRCLDDGLHRRRRPADGHPHRQPRSGRGAVPDGRARHGCTRGRKAAVPAVRPARRLGRCQRHAHAAGEPRTARETCGRSLCLSHRARTGFARGSTGWS